MEPVDSMRETGWLPAIITGGRGSGESTSNAIDLDVEMQPPNSATLLNPDEVHRASAMPQWVPMGKGQLLPVIAYPITESGHAVESTRWTVTSSLGPDQTASLTDEEESIMTADRHVEPIPSTSLHYVIGRELEGILHHSEEEKVYHPAAAAPRLIANPDEAGPSSSGCSSSLLSPAAHPPPRSPISYQDMEMLADLVATRLSRHRTEGEVNEPPPSYS